MFLIMGFTISAITRGIPIVFAAFLSRHQYRIPNITTKTSSSPKNVNTLAIDVPIVPRCACSHIMQSTSQLK